MINSNYSFVNLPKAVLQEIFTHFSFIELCQNERICKTILESIQSIFAIRVNELNLLLKSNPTSINSNYQHIEMEFPLNQTNGQNSSIEKVNKDLLIKHYLTSHLPSTIYDVLIEFFSDFKDKNCATVPFTGPENQKFSAQITLKYENGKILATLLSTNLSLEDQNASIMEVCFKEKQVINWRQGTFSKKESLTWNVSKDTLTENEIEMLVSVLQFWSNQK